MKRVKTSELTDSALNWAVERALGTFWSSNGYFIYNDGEVVDGFYPFTSSPRHHYSTDWAQGGPIIEREGINFFRHNRLDPAAPYVWGAHRVVPRPNMEGGTNMVAFCLEAPSPLVAAMRCYVASKLGDEVDVPEELVK